MAYKIYYETFKKLKEQNLLFLLSKSELKIVDNLFTGLIDPKLFTFDDLCYKLSLMDLETSGYILGFPIKNISPSKTQVMEAINLLSAKGKKEYIEHVKKSHKHDIILPIDNSKTILSNDTDVMMEKIEDYLPFDIVYYQTGE